MLKDRTVVASTSLSSPEKIKLLLAMALLLTFTISAVPAFAQSEFRRRELGSSVHRMDLE